MGNPISLGYGGPLAYESYTVFADHIALLYSSPPTLTGLAALAANWIISGPTVSTVTSVTVSVDTINVYFTAQLNAGTYTLYIPQGVVDGTGYPGLSPAFLTYTAIGVGPVIAAINTVDARLIRVLFNKPVNVSDATNIANWSISSGGGPLSVISATMASVSQVNLITGKQTVGTNYTVTASVRDLAGNPS